MKLNAAQTIAVVGMVAIALVFVKLMYDMSSSVTEMTKHVGSMSQDVAEMRASMHDISGNIVEMNGNMARMEASMRGMGRAVTEGSEQFQQWNQSDMMKQVVPAQPRRTR